MEQTKTFFYIFAMYDTKSLQLTYILIITTWKITILNSHRERKKGGELHMDKRGNMSSRNMRLFAAIMTLIEALVLLSLTGCSGKKVDYGNESEIKETKNMSVLADIRADSGWNENFTIQTGNGEKTIYVNANIVVPDCDNMSVVEVENVKIDADYKKRFLDLYFGGNEYYYH